MALFARRRGRRFFDVTDLIAPCVPLGLAVGRIGNFINGELWGRAADPSLPWAMVFPQSGTDVPRHPSQLYQFALEGVLLFVLLWWYARKPRAGCGQVSGVFLFGYGVLRFIAEYFREPDAFLGLLALSMSMGQWLCVPMVVAGGADGLVGARRQPASGVKLGDRFEFRMRQIFLDTETTGLSARERRPHHRDRLRRDGQPPPDRQQPALLRQSRAARAARTRSRSTA